MWAVYLVMVYTRWIAGWRGRRAAYLASGRFAAAVMAWAANYFSTIHRFVAIMKFQLIGVNHKTAPVEVRERLAIPESRLPEACKRLAEHPGVDEGMILSTCNRVEVLAQTKNGSVPTCADFCTNYFQLKPSELRAAPVRISRAGCGAASVSRDLEPGLDGRGRAADSGAGERGVCHGARCGRGALAA